MRVGPATAVRLLAAAVLLFVAGGPLLTGQARAEPRIVRIDHEVHKGRRLKVTIETEFEFPGEVRLHGTVGGRPFEIVKRVKKPGAKTFRLKVDPKKVKIRKLTDTLVFDLTVEATETLGATVTRKLDVQIPVPVVFFPGLGNELGPTNGIDGFAAAVDLVRGGVHTTDGKKPDLLVVGYDSLSTSIEDSAKSLHKTLKKFAKKSPFKRIDLVGYSMGGLVARSWARSKGRGKVRKLLMLATPNEGAPLAYMAVELTSEDSLFAPLVGGAIDPAGLLGGADSGLGDLGDVLFDPASQDSVRELYPTYPWLTVLFGADAPDASPVLTALNADLPDPDVQFHCLAYSKILPGDGLGFDVGTLETLNLPSLLFLFAGGSPTAEDFLGVFDGDGDGVVPLRSAFLADVPGWADAVVRHDMGAGTHVTLTVDPAMIQEVADVLGE